MIRAEILGLVHDAIKHRPTNTGVWWYICWFDGKIQCLPMSHQPKPEIIFRKMSDWQLTYGLASQNWDVLEFKIYTFLKEKGLCQIQ